MSDLSVGESEWIKLTVMVPGSFWPAWEAAREKVRGLGVDHPVENVHNGMVVEVLVAEFLAGP